MGSLWRGWLHEDVLFDSPWQTDCDYGEMVDGEWVPQPLRCDECMAHVSGIEHIRFPVTVMVPSLTDPERDRYDVSFAEAMTDACLAGSKACGCLPPRGAANSKSLRVLRMFRNGDRKAESLWPPARLHPAPLRRKPATSPISTIELT